MVKIYFSYRKENIFYVAMCCAWILNKILTSMEKRKKIKQQLSVNGFFFISYAWRYFFHSKNTHIMIHICVSLWIHIIRLLPSNMYTVMSRRWHCRKKLCDKPFGICEKFELLNHISVKKKNSFVKPLIKWNLWKKISKIVIALIYCLIHHNYYVVPDGQKFYLWLYDSLYIR